MDTDTLFSNVTSLSGGFFRPNRFMMNIVPPQPLAGARTDLLRVSLNCNATGIPGRTIATRDVALGGSMTRKIPHSGLMNELTTTFYMSKDFSEKHLFEAWIDLIYRASDGILGWYSDYISDMQLDLLNDDITTQAYVFREAYPLSVAEVPLSYDAVNQSGMLSVTWAYREWETV